AHDLALDRAAFRCPHPRLLPQSCPPRRGSLRLTGAAPQTGLGLARRALFAAIAGHHADFGENMPALDQCGGNVAGSGKARRTDSSRGILAAWLAAQRAPRDKPRQRRLCRFTAAPEPITGGPCAGLIVLGRLDPI